MSIESKIHEGELNIKDLNLEKPAPAEVSIFDVEKAISKDDWDKITQAAVEAREMGPENLFFQNKIALYGDMLRDMKTVSPNELLLWEDRGNDWKILSEAIDMTKPWQSLGYVANLLQLFPEDLKIHSEILERGQELFNKLHENVPAQDMSPGIMSTLTDLIKLSPLFGKPQKLVDLIEDYEPSLETKFQQLLSDYSMPVQQDMVPARIDIKNIDLVGMLYYLNVFKVFLGKKTIPTNNQLSKLLGRFLERERPPTEPGTDWWTFIDYAAKIKTIQAKKIQFTTEGVKLVMEEPKSLATENKPLPEIKKF